MAITGMQERFGTRESGPQSERREYTIFGTGAEDNEDALAYLIANAPAVSSLILTDANVTEINTGTHWTGEAVWGPRSIQSLPKVGDVRVSSRSSSQPLNVKFSRSTIQSKAASWFNGGTAIDFKGQLNVDSEGIPRGADVLFPHNVLSVSKVLANSTVTPAYQYATEQLVGHVNSAPYRSRATGTLLCQGVTFAQVDDDNSEVAAEFQFEPNQTGLSVGGITGINKKGWEYIWLYNLPRKESDRVTSQAAQVNVEQIYPTADFAAVLGF